MVGENFLICGHNSCVILVQFWGPVFEGNPHKHRENIQTPHRTGGGNPGPSCCEEILLIPTPHLLVEQEPFTPKK